MIRVENLYKENEEPKTMQLVEVRGFHTGFWQQKRYPAAEATAATEPSSLKAAAAYLTWKLQRPPLPTWPESFALEATAVSQPCNPKAATTYVTESSAPEATAASKPSSFVAAATYLTESSALEAAAAIEPSSRIAAVATLGSCRK